MCHLFRLEMKQQKIDELEEKITTIEKQSAFTASLFIC